MNHTETIIEACRFISQGDIKEAASSINLHYPFQPIEKSSRQYSPREMIKVFVRDGFIDRYKGTRLVYPPALRLISHHLPKELPYHKNGKMTEGHLAYWELFPTIDHIVPVSMGGKDEESNWLCCSMLTNSIKSNWTLEQIGWDLLPSGNLSNWDGMLKWFIDTAENDQEVTKIPYFKKWLNATKDVLAQT
jgi:hypothetical protein